MMYSLTERILYVDFDTSQNRFSCQVSAPDESIEFEDFLFRQGMSAYSRKIIFALRFVEYEVPVIFRFFSLLLQDSFVVTQFRTLLNTGQRGMITPRVLRREDAFNPALNGVYSLLQFSMKFMLIPASQDIESDDPRVCGILGSDLYLNALNYLVLGTLGTMSLSSRSTQQYVEPPVRQPLFPGAMTSYYTQNPEYPVHAF